MNDIKVPPFTEGQKELIEATEKLWCLRFRKSAYEKKFCDVDDVDDDIKDIKEIISETTAKIENQKQTNFQRITASPKALAEFITGLIGIGKCSWCIDGGIPLMADEAKVKKMFCPQTNEEWFCSLPTKEKAHFLSVECAKAMCEQQLKITNRNGVDYWNMWLKQPHKE